MFRSIRHARPGISEGTVRVLEAWGFPWPRGKKNRWEQGCVVGGAAGGGGVVFVLVVFFQSIRSNSDQTHPSFGQLFSS